TSAATPPAPGLHEETLDERRRRGRNLQRTQRDALQPLATRALHARPGNLGLRRTRSPSGLHVPGPGRKAPLDRRKRLQGGADARAADAGPLAAQLAIYLVQV